VNDQIPREQFHWIPWCCVESILQTLGAAEILERQDQPSVSSA
jgi:hypothetical protein